MTREEIINEINCLLSELDNGDDAVSYLTQNDVNWLKENIKALEQEPKWITVTERLPEENERILLNIRMPHYQAVRSGMYHDELFSLDNGDCWRVGDIEAVAWQSLPEPYKAESENT